MAADPAPSPSSAPRPASRPANEPTPSKPKRPPRTPTPAKAGSADVTRAGMIWVAVSAALVLLVLLIVFILQNQDRVTVLYLGVAANFPWAWRCSSQQWREGSWSRSPGQHASSNSEASAVTGPDQQPGLAGP